MEAQWAGGQMVIRLIFKFSVGVQVTSPSLAQVMMMVSHCVPRSHLRVPCSKGVEKKLKNGIAALRGQLKGPIKELLWQHRTGLCTWHSNSSTFLETWLRNNPDSWTPYTNNCTTSQWPHRAAHKMPFRLGRGL